MSKMKGFSLVELMVAMVLGLIITSAVISTYTTSQKNYQLTQAISIQQENSHFVRHFFNAALQDIGFTHGCSSNLPVGNLATKAGVSYDFTLAGRIQGYELAGTVNSTTQTATGTLPAPLTTSSFVAGTDVIEIQTLQDIGDIYISSSQNGGSDSVLRTTATNLDQLRGNDVYAYIAADCSHRRIFYGSTATVENTYVLLNHAKNSPSSNLVQTFNNCANEIIGDNFNCNSISVGQEDNSYLAPGETGNTTFTAPAKLFATEHFVLGIRQAADEPDGIYSLYQIDLQGNTASYETLLLSGITDLQIEYGSLASTAEPINRIERYQTAANVSDWSKVGSIKLTATISSLSKYQGEYQTNKIIQVISLRNRVYR